MPRCQAKFAIFVDKETGHGSAGSVACKLWSCRICRRDRQEFWYSRIKLDMTDGLWEISRFKTHAEWLAFRKLLNRQRRCYVCVRHGGKEDGERIVVHAPRFRTRRYTPDDSKMMSWRRVMPLIKELIFDDSTRAVTVCQKWKDSHKQRMQVMTNQQVDELVEKKFQVIVNKPLDLHNFFLRKLGLSYKLPQSGPVDKSIIDLILLRDFAEHLWPNYCPHGSCIEDPVTEMSSASICAPHTTSNVADKERTWETLDSDRDVTEMPPPYFDDPDDACEPDFSEIFALV